MTPAEQAEVREMVERGKRRFSVDEKDCWCEPRQDDEEPALWIHHDVLPVACVGFTSHPSDEGRATQAVGSLTGRKP